MFSKEIFGKRLSALRIEKGISQQTLAEHLGIGKSAVSMMESGQRGPSIEIASALATYFEVPVDYLLGRGIFAEWDQIVENREAFDDAVKRMFNLDISHLAEDDFANLINVLFGKIVFNNPKEVVIYPLLHDADLSESIPKNMYPES